MTHQPVEHVSEIQHPDYWQTYHPADLLHWAAEHRTEAKIESTGIEIHLDLYEQSDSSAPVLLFNHGGGGYSRLFIPIAQALYELGYTVVLPDQRGQGLSGGSRSDFRLGQFVENIVDSAVWARQRYSGPLIMAGASLGSALTYNAVAAGAPVDVAIYHNLYDFGRAYDILAVSSFAPIAGWPGVAPFFSAVTRAAAILFPRLRIPYQMLGKFDKMVDERAADFYTAYQRDPYPIRRITLDYMLSTFNTPPARPLEANTTPSLVINPIRDQMVDPEITRLNYERLGGEKLYGEIETGHWMIGHGFEAEWAALVDRFVRQQVGFPMS